MFPKLISTKLFFIGTTNDVLISVTGFNRVDASKPLTANAIDKEGMKSPITLTSAGSGAFTASLVPPSSEYKIQIQGNFTFFSRNCNSIFEIFNG